MKSFSLIHGYIIEKKYSTFHELEAVKQANMQLSTETTKRFKTTSNHIKYQQKIFSVIVKQWQKIFFLLG